MNSPVSGSTLLQMVTATGGGAAFMAAFPSADATHIAIYFLMIGGTRIVLGAADGISIGLKQGLSHIFAEVDGRANNYRQCTQAKKATPSRSTKVVDGRNG